MLAAPTYAGQLCFTNLDDCNLYSPCAYLSPRRECNASLASVFTTCTSGPANLNSSNLAKLQDGMNFTVVPRSNATGTWSTDYYSDATHDNVDQFVCDAVNEDFGAIPGASGLLCYPTPAACASDPLNPCSASTPCALDLTWCGSGMALAFGSKLGANNSWACTALQVPAGARPQGNEFQCFDSRAHCGARPRRGYALLPARAYSPALFVSLYRRGCSCAWHHVCQWMQRQRRGLHGCAVGCFQCHHRAANSVPLRAEHQLLRRWHGGECCDCALLGMPSIVPDQLVSKQRWCFMLRRHGVVHYGGSEFLPWRVTACVP